MDWSARNLATRPHAVDHPIREWPTELFADADAAATAGNDSSQVLIDARSPDRFSGENEPETPKRDTFQARSISRSLKISHLTAFSNPQSCCVKGSKTPDAQKDLQPSCTAVLELAPATTCWRSNMRDWGKRAFIRRFLVSVEQQRRSACRNQLTKSCGIRIATTVIGQTYLPHGRPLRFLWPRRIP